MFNRKNLVVVTVLACLLALWGLDVFAAKGGKKPKPPPEPTDPADPAIMLVRHPGEICVMDQDGANLTTLHEGDAMDSAPSWSPDGKQAVFTEGLGSGSIWKIDVSVVDGVPHGSNLALLHDPEEGVTSGARWSPTGNEIAFIVAQPKRLQVIPRAGGVPTTLYSGNESPDSVGAAFPTWSPDGSRIAFTVEGTTASGRLVKVLDRATRTVTNVFGPFTDDPLFLDWARTQDLLVYAEETSPRKITILDLETGETTTIGEGSWPTWAPDDSRIAFKGTYYESRGKKLQAKTGLVVYDLATGETTPLRDGGTFRNLSWRR